MPGTLHTGAFAKTAVHRDDDPLNEQGELDLQQFAHKTFAPFEPEELPPLFVSDEDD